MHFLIISPYQVFVPKNPKEYWAVEYQLTITRTSIEALIEDMQLVVLEKFRFDLR